MPPPSPGCKSASSVLKRRRSAQRMYIRSSISAQSCASVPPAPGCTVTMALPASCSPPSIWRISISPEELLDLEHLRLGLGPGFLVTFRGHLQEYLGVGEP